MAKYFECHSKIKLFSNMSIRIESSCILDSNVVHFPKKCLLQRINISFSNLVSVNLQRSGLKNRPAAENTLSTGAEEAGMFITE